MHPTLHVTMSMYMFEPLTIILKVTLELVDKCLSYCLVLPPMCRRDYHRVSRSHRDSSARWDRESSRDRRMYGNSEERSGRHGSGRHSGWDREGDYHRDDYWMDSGGTHYDRGTRDYERSSRQRGETERKRGAEYFMQEARRRKHEADKIPVRFLTVIALTNTIGPNLAVQT